MMGTLSLGERLALNYDCLNTLERTERTGAAGIEKALPTMLWFRHDVFIQRELWLVAKI